MRRIVLVVVLSLLLAGVAWSAPVKTVALVYTPNLQTMLALDTYDVGYEESGRPGWTRIIAPRATVQQLIDTGFEVDILIDDLDAWVKARNAWMEAHPDQEVEGEITLDHYLTHPEVETFLEDLAVAYSDIMSLDVIGTSVGGRELFLVKISDNVETNENEPAIFFEYNIHGDEIAAYINMLHFIEWLATNYGTDPEITAVVDSREIFIEPLTNPDGNQATALGRSRYNNHGVDMNRNFGFMWSQWEANPGSTLHSEPEIQAVTDVWMGPQPYMFGLSGHSGTVVFLWAWGYHGNVPLDNAEMAYLSEEYCYPNHCLDPNMNEWGQTSHALYYCWGTAMDEMYGSHGMLGTTAELTYTKQCSFTESITVAEEHEPALMWVLQEIGNGLHGTVTDDTDGAPLMAVIEVDGKWATFTDYEVGDFHKYLRPGTYDVRIWANGYDEYNDTVIITEGSPFTLDVEMTASAEPITFATRLLMITSPNDNDTDTLSIDALGEPDGEFVSIGNGGWCVLDLGPDGIDDGTGNDIAVYESHGDGAESFTIYGSDHWRGPWTQIGTGTGSTEFDLDDSGLTNVRYVKIVDGSKNADAGEYDGYDLDAVGTPLFVANFGGDPVSGYRPLDVQFTDNSTGNPTAWEWDFGDGGSSTEQNPSHEYTAAGTYTVSLTVTSAQGTENLTKTDYIEVTEAPPTAEFSADPLSGPKPLEVDFTDESTGTVNSYFWTFGDGGTSMDQNPTHTYTAVGKWSVKLTVNGPGGSDTRTRWWYITVTDEPIDDDTVDDDTVPDDDTVVDDDTVIDDDTTPVDDDTTPVDDDTTPDDDDITPPDDDTTDDDTAPPVDNDDDDDDDDGCGCQV